MKLALANGFETKDLIHSDDHDEDGDINTIMNQVMILIYG